MFASLVQALYMLACSTMSAQRQQLWHPHLQCFDHQSCWMLFFVWLLFVSSFYSLCLYYFMSSDFNFDDASSFVIFFHRLLSLTFCVRVCSFAALSSSLSFSSYYYYGFSFGFVFFGLLLPLVCRLFSDSYDFASFSNLSSAVLFFIVWQK